jgi:hypothetical protein
MFRYFIIEGKSLIYNKKKSNGPRIDPWGTPCLTRPQSDSLVGCNHVGFSTIVTEVSLLCLGALKRAAFTP